jgi:hypothetical protein
MRKTQSKLATAVLVALGIFGRAGAIADDKSPEEVLKSRGLTRSGTVYIVEAESDLVLKVAKLRPSFQQLYAVYRKLAPIMQLQAEYDMLDDQWTVVNEQLRNVQAEIDAHPPLRNSELKENWQNLLEAERQLRLQYNHLRTEVNLRYKRLASDAEKERLQDEFLKQRKDFVENSKELRDQVEKVKGDYIALAKDDAIKKSLATLKLSTKAAVSLGPSADFKRESTWLINAVRSTSPESLKPKSGRRNSRNAARDKTSTKGKETTPAKKPPSKSEKKGTKGDAPDSGDTKAIASPGR